MSLEKDFVPPEQALELKHIGFDEECLGLFVRDESLLLKQMPNQQECELYFGGILAPLKSQAMRFFREKYELHYVIVKTGSWFYTINGCNTQEGFNTYEEAESACLDELIEIVKQQNNV